MIGDVRSKAVDFDALRYCLEIKEPRKDRPSRGVLVIRHQLLLANEYTSFIILVTREEVH